MSSKLIRLLQLVSVSPADHTLSLLFPMGWSCFCGFVFMIIRSKEKNHHFFHARWRPLTVTLKNVSSNVQKYTSDPFLLTQILYYRKMMPHEKIPEQIYSKNHFGFYVFYSMLRALSSRQLIQRQWLPGPTLFVFRLSMHR
jgi:hypothetical protein